LWEDCVKDVVSVPAKVANATGGRSDIPSGLESGTYINGVCRRVEVLIERFSKRPGQGGLPQSYSNLSLNNFDFRLGEFCVLSGIKTRQYWSLPSQSSNDEILPIFLAN
jgi:hypothetical protein